MSTQEALDLARDHFASVARVDALHNDSLAAAKSEAIDFWKIVIRALEREVKRKK